MPLKIKTSTNYHKNGSYMPGVNRRPVERPSQVYKLHIHRPVGGIPDVEWGEYFQWCPCFNHHDLLDCKILLKKYWRTYASHYTCLCLNCSVVIAGAILYASLMVNLNQKEIVFFVIDFFLPVEKKLLQTGQCRSACSSSTYWLWPDIPTSRYLRPWSP